MARETELKFRVPPGTAGKLLQSRWLKKAAISAKDDIVTSVYFDTKSLKLRRHGLSVRVRDTADRHLQTIKSDASGGLSERGEWESEIKGDLPDRRAMRGTPLKRLVTKKTQRKLHPVFETRVRRTVIPVTAGRSLIEVALDHGKIRSGRKAHAIREIELELKRGKTSALFDLGKKIVEHVPAQLVVESKADQGYTLLGHPPSHRAEMVHLNPDITTGDALTIIAASCIRHFVRNTTDVLDGEPEGIHQMRVGIRRLRAAISLFGALLPEAETAAVKVELKWLGSQLARARDLDVLAHNDALQRTNKMPGMGAFKERLSRSRTAAFTQAKRAVASPRYKRLVMMVATWSQAGAWTRNTATRQRALRRQPIREFADDVLSRRSKKVLKQAAKIDSLDARKRHTLRIAIKKLRYATDFFASVFPGRKADRRRSSFEKTLSDLQDCLGLLNDIAVHRDLAAAVAHGKSGARNRATNDRVLFAAGSIAGQEQSETQSIMQQASKAARRLIRQPVFW